MAAPSEKCPQLGTSIAEVEAAAAAERKRRAEAAAAEQKRRTEAAAAEQKRQAEAAAAEQERQAAKSADDVITQWEQRMIAAARAAPAKAEADRKWAREHPVANLVLNLPMWAGNQLLRGFIWFAEALFVGLAWGAWAYMWLLILAAAATCVGLVFNCILLVVCGLLQRCKFCRECRSHHTWGRSGQACTRAASACRGRQCAE